MQSYKSISVLQGEAGLEKFMQVFLAKAGEDFSKEKGEAVNFLASEERFNIGSVIKILKAGFIEGDEDRVIKNKEKEFRRPSLIQDTNLIASPGPTTETMPIFLQDLYEAGVKHIIALGEGKKDFCDYWREAPNVKNIIKPEEDSCYLGSVVKSKITIPNGKSKPRTVSIMHIDAKDGAPLGIISENVNRKNGIMLKKQAALWEAYLLSLEEKTLIHCRAGLGRTGIVILMFMLLKKSQDIFCGTNREVVGKIFYWLDYLCDMRAGLVSTQEQLEESVLVSFSIALKKGLLKEEALLSSGQGKYKGPEKKFAETSLSFLPPLGTYQGKSSSCNQLKLVVPAIAFNAK